MAFIIADRVKETTSVEGTGAVVLGGAIAGYQPFSVIGNGNSTFYLISNLAGTIWEIGLGTYTASTNSLSRDTVLSSSNSNNPVNFAEGAKVVSLTQPAERAVYSVGSDIVAANGATLPNSSTTATSANTPNAIVARDGSGNFSAGTITASLSGNATSATTATTATTAGAVTSAVTFNNSGTGAASGTTFNGSAAQTISYNTLGAQPTLVSGTNIKTVNGSSLLGSGNLSVTTAPAGSNREIQFNSFGSFAASSAFTVNTNNNSLAVFGPITSGLVTVSGGSGSNLFSTALGNGVLFSNTTGESNTAVGYESLRYNTIGSQNTGFGYYALRSTTTGFNNTAIGYNAQASSATVSDTITLGNSSITTLRCQVTTITALSDARDKTNIVDIPAGLSFIQALRPVAFDWDMRDGGKVGVHEFGFIAQELQAAQTQTGISVPNLVYDDNPEKLEASSGTLIPILVKAIQELKAELDAVKAQIKEAP